MDHLLTRPSSLALDSILGAPFPVLDHGFIRVIDYLGNDEAVVQAARTSYGKGTKATSEDRGLIRYLLSHRHTTPFEMCELKLHCKMPIFVARQWVRHRMANINEYSARYSILDKEYYIPETDRLQEQSTVNKQGSGDELPADVAQATRAMMQFESENAYAAYEAMIDPKVGLSRELARTVLPVNYYTQWYWKVDLHNLLHFLKLRADPHAQYEIRVYADVILKIVQMWVPLVYEAFMDYVVGSTTFSKHEMAQLHYMLGYPEEQFEIQEDSGLSDRESKEFLKKLGIQV